MPDAREFSLGVVILAAGYSSRMGRPKLLLPWGRTSVLGHLIETWTKLAATQVAVVCQESDTAIQGELERVRFTNGNRIFNPNPDRGMFSSIVCAAHWQNWNQSLTHWALALGDQPHLAHQTLRDLLEAAHREPAKISQPARSGHGRHPVILPKNIFQQIASTQAATLKEFLTASSPLLNLVGLADPGLDLDLDTPEDYATALNQFLKQ